MSLPSGKIDIINMAFDYLGQTPIADIDKPETINERLAARNYDQARRSVFRKYSPHCCKKSTTCSRAGSGDSEYADAYTLPSDYIRLLSVSGNQVTAPDDNFDIRGRSILINNGGGSSITIWYVSDLKEVALWDPLTIQVVVLTLALQMAYQVTKKKSVVDHVNTLLTLELRDMMSINGQEVRVRRIQNSKSVAARRGLSSRNVASQFVVFE